MAGPGFDASHACTRAHVCTSRSRRRMSEAPPFTHLTRIIRVDARLPCQEELHARSVEEGGEWGASDLRKEGRAQSAAGGAVLKDVENEVVAQMHMGPYAPCLGSWTGVAASTRTSRANRAPGRTAPRSSIWKEVDPEIDAWWLISHSSKWERSAEGRIKGSGQIQECRSPLNFSGEVLTTCISTPHP